MVILVAATTVVTSVVLAVEALVVEVAGVAMVVGEALVVLELDLAVVSRSPLSAVRYFRPSAPSLPRGRRCRSGKYGPLSRFHGGGGYPDLDLPHTASRFDMVASRSGRVSQ